MGSEVMTPTSRSGDALPAWTTVLAVVAHPDDESFGLGALLDAFTSAGAGVEVLPDPWRGIDAARSPWRPRLAAGC